MSTATADHPAKPLYSTASSILQRIPCVAGPSTPAVIIRSDAEAIEWARHLAATTSGSLASTARS